MGKKIKYTSVKTKKVYYYDEENIGPEFTYKDLIKMGELPEMWKEDGNLKTFSELSEETQKLFSEYGIDPKEYEGGM